MSGGFYKYRCKYFYTHNCQNWAEGRDDETAPTSGWMMSRDIAVPCVQDGVLQYALMELVAPAVAGEEWYLGDKTSRIDPAGPANDAISAPAGNTSTENWTIRDKAARPPPAVPVTSAMPEVPGLVSSGE
ncbi:uncharacterized protein MAM_00838 [Metarhizium album ARSEF 1941]|uniref:Uncharacterized protein n=1 Tax=Metarhizium album (strain ARSEF 1941) TaxID=1081103 RepID=A0A0B2WZZ7_METAS|nr:uncharacterized protein MAM_00838 [Metarhizium album ARSEF 1941]KHO01837.1 hypothetical protein MAM_00838 [Metarhizium album ARSEF 1941]